MLQEKLELQFFKKFKWGGIPVRVSDVKREYQLQEWRGMLRECKESGLTVKNWCAERGITEHAYYYRLRKLRQAACEALQQAQPVQLAEIPLAPKETEFRAQLRLTTQAGTLEIADADCEVLDHVLRVMLHAE